MKKRNVFTLAVLLMGLLSTLLGGCSTKPDSQPTGGTKGTSGLASPIAVPTTGEPIYIPAGEFARMDEAYISFPVTHNGEGGLLHWKEYGGTLTYEADVPEAGMYYLTLSYAPLESRSDFIELNLAVNATAQGTFLLERPLHYGDITRDAAGLDLRPVAELDDAFYDKELRRCIGTENDPLALELKRGVNTITFDGRRTDFILRGLTLTPGSTAPAYAGPEEGWAMAGHGQKVQAEKIYRSSASTLTAQYDCSDALVEPADPARMTLNIAGGENWRSDGQWMEWQVEAPKDGLYSLQFKARQNMKSGLESNRRLYVDGTLPCAEAYNIAFPYSSDWRIHTFRTAGGEDVLLPLTAGTHTIRLEVVPGQLSHAGRAVSEILGSLNEVYRQIIMVTGTSPDPNRDYALELEVPDLLATVEKLAQELGEQREWLVEQVGQKGDELAVLTNLYTQLNSFLDQPETIPARVGNLKGNIDSLGTWLLTLSEQPLDLDYLAIVGTQDEPAAANASFGANLAFGAKSLLSSFFTDYSGASGSKETLQVWVNMGRDQMQIVKQLADDVFTPKTGIHVEFSVVQQGINEAILAGSGPDVVLFAPSTEPVNLAMRGALLPLDAFEGFEAVSGEMQPGACVPYQYKGRTYGLPFTQQYTMLFYRTDILGELGLTPPETWQELYQSIPVIQRKNMQVGVPSGDNTFATLLFQRGSEFYNDERTATTFQENDSVEAFKQYTRLFSDYGLPLTYDFFNRFRSGEMPLAIADYTEYNRLSVAAPEIAGLWSMAPMPGTLRADGTVDRTIAASSGLGGYILADSDRGQEAWQFLSWFASGEAQADFGRKSESLLGPVGRYAAANQLAFASLPWLSEESALLMGQWENVRENPQLPGSYYTQRNLANAFRNVVLNHKNPREMLDLYGQEIDRELERKRAEYGRIK